VSGHKPVSMERLRGVFVGQGFADVRTYVQSGNVVFRATANSGRALERKISFSLEQEFGFTIQVILRTAKDFVAIAESHPFSKGIDTARLYVTFLREAAPKEVVLEPLSQSQDEFQLRGHEIYLHCPDGYGRTKLSNTYFEKKLGLEATTRNWKTVTTLRAMAAE